MKKLLSLGFIYNGFANTIGKFGISQLQLFSKYVPYTPGMSILDLAVPGTNTKSFMPSDYLGIDISTRYIESARASNPNHEFFVEIF